MARPVRPRGLLWIVNDLKSCELTAGPSPPVNKICQASNGLSRLLSKKRALEAADWEALLV